MSKYRIGISFSLFISHTHIYTLGLLVHCVYRCVFYLQMKRNDIKHKEPAKGVEVNMCEDEINKLRNTKYKQIMDTNIVRSP